MDGPAQLAILIAGITYSAYLSLNQWHIQGDIQTNVAPIVGKIGSASIVGVGAFLGIRIGRFLLDFYSEHVAIRTSTQLDNQLIPSFKRMLPILIYSLGILWMLAIFEIEISPLLATLGIGGIAIALAAQPTLSNYFAGTYVISEGEIEVGGLHRDRGWPVRICGGYILA